MNSFFSAGVPPERIRRYVMCSGLQIGLFYSAWNVLGAIGNLQLGSNFTSNVRRCFSFGARLIGTPSVMREYKINI